MNCARCSTLLSRYHDGELDLAAREQVRAHLHGCERCRSQLAAFEQMDAAIRAALRRPPRHAATEIAVEAAVLPLLVRTMHPRRTMQIILGGATGACTAALIVLTLIVAAGVPTRHVQVAHSPSMPARPSARAVPVRSVAAVRAPLSLAPPARAIQPRPRRSDGDVLAPILIRARATLPAQPRPTRTTPSLRTRALPPDRAAYARVLQVATLGERAIRMPVWSSDSASLLYVTDWQPDPASTWYSGTLYRYAPGGAVMLHRLVRNYAWSADGAHIVYAAQATARADGEAQDLYLADTDGSQARVLCGVDRASVAYIGNQIVAVQHGTLVTIDPISGTSSALTDLPALTVADEDTAFWAISADLRFFAYQDGSGLRIWDRQRLGLLVVDQPLARLGESSFHFSWDGDTVFFSTFDGKRAMLFRQRLAPDGLPLALNDGRPLPNPILTVGPVSADGAKLGFVSTGQGGRRGYVVDTARGAAHPVLPPGGVGPVYGPAPDGARFAYTLYRGNDVVASGLARML